MANKRLIKIYGERNTGTNYLSKLIELNLDVEQLPGVVPGWLLDVQEGFPAKEVVRDLYFTLTFRRNLGWKHMLVKRAEELLRNPACSDRLAFLTLTKNPYSWLLSLYRKPYHKSFSGKPDFASFIARPWKCVGRDNLAGDLSSPVELWNLKNASYIQLAEKLPVVHLGFEGLLQDPEQLLKRISDDIACEWRQPHFINYDKSTKESSKNSDFYRDYYLNEKWKSEFSAAAVDIVNERLDRQVMEFFGYGVWDGS